MSYDALLTHARDLALRYLETLPDRPVRARSAPPLVPSPLADDPQDPTDTLDAIASALEVGSLPTAGPRYFGFVIGGSLPVAVAADWLGPPLRQNPPPRVE